MVTGNGEQGVVCSCAPPIQMCMYSITYSISCPVNIIHLIQAANSPKVAMHMSLLSLYMAAKRSRLIIQELKWDVNKYKLHAVLLTEINRTIQISCGSVFSCVTPTEIHLIAGIPQEICF